MYVIYIYIYEVESIAWSWLLRAGGEKKKKDIIKDMPFKWKHS